MSSLYEIRRTGFLTCEVEIIRPRNEVFFVGTEISSRCSPGPLVHGINLFESHNPLSLVLLDGEFRFINGNCQFIYLEDSFQILIGEALADGQ